MKKQILGLCALSLLVAACGQNISRTSDNNPDVIDNGGEFGTTQQGVIAASLANVSDDVVRIEYYIVNASNGFGRNGAINFADGIQPLREGGIPLGTGYTLEVQVELSDGTYCMTTVYFDMDTIHVKNINVHVICGGGVIVEQDEQGDVVITVDVSQHPSTTCPVVTGMSVRPLEVPVGHTINLEGYTSSSPDLHLWTCSSGGTFSTMTSSVTDFHCQFAGDHALTYGIMKQGCAGQAGMDLTVQVTCTATTSMPTTEVGMCNDGIDNDNDGDEDCDDVDCSADPACYTPPAVEICDDVGKMDEDGNGFANCADNACISHPSCSQAVCLPQSPVEIRVKPTYNGNVTLVTGATYNNGTNNVPNVNFTQAPFNASGPFTFHNANDHEIRQVLSPGQVFTLPCSTSIYGFDNGPGSTWWTDSPAQRLTWSQARIECRTRDANGNPLPWQTVSSLTPNDAGFLCDIN